MEATRADTVELRFGSEHPVVQEDPLEKEMTTCSSILAWKISHRQGSLEGYSPWGCKELAT